MPFILSEQRQEDVDDAFRRYRDYLTSKEHSFPRSAYTLATSDWYFNFEDLRSPHDSWLEHVLISEPSGGERRENRKVTIAVTLLGAYHDKRLVFRYPTVYSYRLTHEDVNQGHRDWRYDEFRVSEAGHLIHEIEWRGAGESGRWLIVADDVQYEVVDI